MLRQTDISDQKLYAYIRRGTVRFAGNFKLKIYGALGCSSGKRLKKINRVFFESAEEATENNFRPCGHCMTADYKIWKDESL